MKSDKTTEKFKTIDIILIGACLILLFVSYLNVRKRKQIMEVKNLPYTNVSVESVADGSYIGDIATSFLCIKVQVDVENHQIQNIQLLEKSGTKKQDKAEELFEKMKEENKSFVTVIENEELIDLVYICCVDNALSQGVPKEAGQES